MKISSTLFLALLVFTAQAQKVFVDGTPIYVVDADNADSVNTIGHSGYDGIKLSADSSALYPWDETANRILIVAGANDSIADSIDFVDNLWDWVDGGDNNSLIATHNPATNMYKWDLGTKMPTDSAVGVGGTMISRPGSSEIWVYDLNTINIMTTPSDILTVPLGLPGSHQVRGLTFNADGSNAYFSINAINKPGKIFKINATTKAIIDTFNTPESWANLKALTVSADESTLWMTFWGKWPNEPSKIYTADAAAMAISDSTDVPGKPFTMYEHPSKSELWVIYHYEHKIKVHNKADLTTIDSVDVGTSPKNLVFTNHSVPAPPVGVVNTQHLMASIYPNPANDKLWVKLDRSEASFQLSDMLGRSIINQELNSRRTLINLADIPAGLYLIKISSNGIESNSKLFVE